MPSSALRSPELRRPGVLTALAVLDFTWAVLGLAPALYLAGRLGRLDTTPSLLAATGACSLLAATAVVAGIGLLQLEEYGRRTQIGLGVLALPLIPVGTLVGVLLHAYLAKERTRLLFAGRGAAAAADAGPGAAQGLALAGVVLGFILAGLVALVLLALLVS